MTTTMHSDRTLLDSYFREHQRVVQATFEKLESSLSAAGAAVVQCLQDGHKVLAFGNGGSATQASHLAGELVGRFSKTPRNALPAIALSSDPGILTCIGNDFGYGALFERQVAAFAQPGDVAIGFTTSGTSENVVRGLGMAGEKRAVTMAFTGQAGFGALKPDHLLPVPSDATSFIQELHLIFVHVLYVYVDRAFTSSSADLEAEWKGKF